MDATKEPQCRHAVILEGDYESTGFQQGLAMPEMSIDCVHMCIFFLLRCSFKQKSDVSMSMLCNWACL